MTQPRRVMLMVEASLSFSRDLVAGVTQYTVQHGPWSVQLAFHEQILEPREWLNGWQGDGVISRSTTPEVAEYFHNCGMPIVDLTDRYVFDEPNSNGRAAIAGLPSIWNAHEEIGAAAATHLIERGFRHFAFCGYEAEGWSRMRLAGFSDALKKELGEHISIPTFRSPWVPAANWDQEPRAIADWLSELPTPCGILACNDLRGIDVLAACRRLGVAVPEQVAVVGVDNDEAICTLCDPPLTSIGVAGERIGYEAAAMLDKLMSGQEIAVDERHKQVAPSGVVSRASTDTLAIDDEHVAEAVRLIREQACDGLTVPQVLEAVPLSRSILERRFRKFLGRSPQAEIRVVRLKRAQQLLSETAMSLDEIAERTAFEHTEYLSVMFKREIGVTPGQYRTMQRQGGAITGP